MQISVSVAVSLFYSYCVKYSLPFSLSLSLSVFHIHTLFLSFVHQTDRSQLLSVTSIFVSLSLPRSVSRSAVCLSHTLYALSLTCHHSQRVLSQGVLREGVTMRSIVDFSTAYCAQCASFYFWQWGDLKSLQN